MFAERNGRGRKTYVRSGRRKGVREKGRKGTTKVRRQGRKDSGIRTFVVEVWTGLFFPVSAFVAGNTIRFPQAVTENNRGIVQVEEYRIIFWFHYFIR